VANRQSVVYETRNRLSELEIFGCAYGRHRSYDLGGPSECGGSEEGCSGIGAETLAGTIVAYEEFETRTCCASMVVVVRDLRTGRLLHGVPSGTSQSPNTVGGGFTRGLVVKSDGAGAWIVAGGPARGGNQVHVLDKGGSRIVASGTDVAENSLALAGSTLYWTQAGQAFSTMLD
jgi:hypothetical protein